MVRCPACQTPMQRRGQRTWHVLTRRGVAADGSRVLRLSGLWDRRFPLDDALGLGGSRYSAQILAWLARLGAEVPFARAAFSLEELTTASS